MYAGAAPHLLQLEVALMSRVHFYLRPSLFSKATPCGATCTVYELGMQPGLQVVVQPTPGTTCCVFLLLAYWYKSWPSTTSVM